MRSTPLLSAFEGKSGEKVFLSGIPLLGLVLLSLRPEKTLLFGVWERKQVLPHLSLHLVEEFRLEAFELSRFLRK